MIDIYQNYCNGNSFIGISCSECDSFDIGRHSTYKRNYVDDDIDYDFKILVLECNECGRYHSLLPDFIIPYHVYSPNDIFSALKKDKPVYRQLLRYWTLKFIAYLNILQILVASNDKEDILNKIVNNYYHYYELFFEKFEIIFFHYLNSQSP